MIQDDVPQWDEDYAQGLEELDDDASRLQALFADPQAHIDDLRRDERLQIAIARADSIVKLRRWFGEQAGWVPFRERSGLLGDASAGVEWSYSGVHDTDGAFNGLRATQRGVTVRGFTIMGIDDGEFKIRRYIDWAGLFAQLGLTLNWRIPLEDVDVLHQRVAQVAAD